MDTIVNKDQETSSAAPTGRRRLRRWLLAAAITVGVLLVASVAATWWVTSKIRGELAELAREQLGGELREASITYRPPYGALVRNVRVVTKDAAGRERDVFRAARLDLRLAKRPRKGEPVQIVNLAVREPSLHLLCESPGGDCPNNGLGPRPQKSDDEPSKPLSAVVRLDRLHIEGGSVTYEQRGTGRPPMTWGGIGIDVHPPQAPKGPQAFAVSMKGEGTQLSAGGEIRPDDLIIGVKELAADVRVDRAGMAPAALPGPLADVIREHRVAGAVRVRASGTLPLRRMAESTFSVTVDAADGAAADVGPGLAFDSLSARLTCDTATLPPAESGTLAAATAAPKVDSKLPPLHVKLERFVTNVGPNVLRINGGEFWRDPARGTWKVAQLAGALETPPPAGVIAADVRSAGATADREPADADDESDRPERPTTGKTRVLGRVEFTAAATGPLAPPPGQTWVKAAKYELLAFPRDAVFKLKKWPLPVHGIGGGSIRAADGVVVFRDVQGYYGHDRLNLLGARVPIPANVSDLWKLETRVEEMSGTLLARHPSPPYPRGVNGVFKFLGPEGVFTLGGRLTLRHDRHPDGTGVRDDVQLDVIADGRPALHMTGRRIPLTNVKGRATIDPAVMIDIAPTQARAFGGTVTAEMRIKPGRKGSPVQYEGRGWLRDADMVAVAKTIDPKGEGKLNKLSGRGHLDARFAWTGPGGPVRPLQSLTADGELQILGCQFWNDPILGRVVADVRTGASRSPGDAAAVFSVEEGVVTIHNAAVNSPSVGLAGSGRVSFDKRLDLQLTAVPVGDLRDKLTEAGVPIVGDVVGAVQQLFKGATTALLYQYQITGPANDPVYTLVPTPVLTEPLAALFGQMARGRPTDPLIDAVRPRDRPPLRQQQQQQQAQPAGSRQRGQPQPRSGDSR